MNIQVVGHRHWPKPSTPRGPAPHIRGLMRKKGNRRKVKQGLCHPLHMTGTILILVFFVAIMVQMKVLWMMMMMMTEEETKINNVSVPNLGKSSSSVDVERISYTPDDQINKEQPNNDSPRERPNNDYPPRIQMNNDPPREQTKQHLPLGQSVTKSRNPMITLVCLSGAYDPERYSDVRRIVEVAVHNPLIARVVLVLNDASSDINVLKSALEYEKNMVHWTEDLNVVVDVLKAERNSLNNRYDRSLLNIT